MPIGGYFIDAYWWLFFIILLTPIDAYFINDSW
jgi:hypothetical protein